MIRNIKIQNNIDMMMKRIAILILFNMTVLYTCASSAEHTDTIPSNNILNKKIFIIGVQKMDSMIGIENLIGYNNGNVIIHERNLEYYNEYYSYVNISKKTPYVIFDSTVYLLENHAQFTWRCLLDNMPLDIKTMLLKTYPYDFLSRLSNKIFAKEMYSYKDIKYRKLQHQFFLVLLVQLSYYEEYLAHWSHFEKSFPNLPALQGTYIKLLVPLIEEDEKKE